MRRIFRGELVLMHLHDLGGEVRMAEAARLLADAVGAGTVEPGKSAPSYMALPRPLVVRYPPRQIETDQGVRTVALEARVHAIGAVTMLLRIPFEVDGMEAFAALTHVRLSDGGSLERITREAQADLARTLAPALVETYQASVDPEGYFVIVLTRSPRPAWDLLSGERRLLAGVLAGEKRPERLSAEEVEDNLRTWFSYYEDDLVIVDWERALVVEPSGKYEDVLSVMEAANLELLELRAYDRYLDDVLEEAYEDLTRFYGRGGLFRSARDVQRDLSDARIDLVRVTDAINNIGKIFGDFYLAKLHLGLAERMHLREWETIVREKMETLNGLYTLASHEVEHRRGILLEGMIVLLFILDLILLFLVSK